MNPKHSTAFATCYHFTSTKCILQYSPMHYVLYMPIVNAQ